MDTTAETELIPTGDGGAAEARARPFVKWAGGKRNLVPEIAQVVPDNIGVYWEPFAGGGAVFFGLGERVRSARLSDVNGELAIAYQIVKEQPEELIASLQKHAGNHQDKKYFYRVRAGGYSNDPVEVAARLIYLNKTCFNGLYRVNKKGQFNVPRGNYTNPNICDADGIRSASKALKKAAIQFGDFGDIQPSEGDLVYCDPPYDGTFANYSPGGFGDEEQRRLRMAAQQWHENGVKVIISNADTQLIRNLYGGPPFTIRQVSSPRPINSNGEDRGPTPELIITTYDAS